MFTIGTTNYIDTLNPFNYIEAEAVTAYLEVYPELVQLAPNLTTYEGSYALKLLSHSSDFKTYTYVLQLRAASGRTVSRSPRPTRRGRRTRSSSTSSDATANVANAVAHVANVNHRRTLTR